MPSKVIIIVIEFMILGINMFWALLRVHFNPRPATRAKMSISRAQNTFMLYCFISFFIFFCCADVKMFLPVLRLLLLHFTQFDGHIFLSLNP